MKEQILENLFDSPIKFRLLRFFVRNENGFFQIPEITKKTRIGSRSIKSNIEKLKKLNLLSEKIQKRRKKLYSLNKKFLFYNELKSLILKSGAIDPKRFLKILKNLGGVALAIITGIFLNEEHSRIDLLLVGGIRARKLRKFIEKLEAEVGAEIRYSAMDRKEFEYRYDMYDRFVRNILEHPHEKLINKLKI